MAKIKVTHVAQDVTTWYECDQVEPFGQYVVLINATIVKIERPLLSLTGIARIADNPPAAEANPSRVFLLTGQVRVYGALRVSMGGSATGQAIPV